MTNRKTLLNNLLRPLVQEWGCQEVENALKRVAEDSRTSEASPQRSNEPGVTPRTRAVRKLRASEQVARAHLPEAQEAAMLDIATRFDQKQFLPSVSDVREFLVMMGERPRAMKDRSEAFRCLLKALSGLPPEHLKKLANNALHSGPSQLGPLSDAIASAAVSLSRQREPDVS